MKARVKESDYVEAGLADCKGIAPLLGSKFDGLRRSYQAYRQWFYRLAGEQRRYLRLRNQGPLLDSCDPGAVGADARPWQRQWPASVEFAYVDDISPQADDQLVWQDATGSLTLWKAGEPTNRNYRLRLKNWSVVDLLPGKRLVVSAPRDASKAVHEHFLADQVVPRAIAHSGKLVRHAAAVRTGDEAILLLGASGLGKSTLSASFQSAGHCLIGDDAIYQTDFMRAFCFN